MLGMNQLYKIEKKKKKKKYILHIKKIHVAQGRTTKQKTTPSILLYFNSIEFSSVFGFKT